MHRKLMGIFWTVAGTGAASLLVWLASAIWATKADASGLTEVKARVDAVLPQILERLGRIESKVDDLRGRGGK